MAKNISRHYKIEKVLLLLFFSSPFPSFLSQATRRQRSVTRVDGSVRLVSNV